MPRVEFTIDISDPSFRALIVKGVAKRCAEMLFERSHELLIPPAEPDDWCARDHITLTKNDLAIYTEAVLAAGQHLMERLPK